MNKFKFDIQKNNLSWEKTHYKKCDSPKCNEKGEFRAPKSRVMLNEYFYFCLDHIKEYNKSWDFYRGMSVEQIEHSMRSDTFWDRPSWPLKNSFKNIFDEFLLPESIYITHAHIGHYTGLMYFGREALGANDLMVKVLPRMSNFLQNNGPWSQLVANENIELRPTAHDDTLQLTKNLSVIPILVPHRDEYSETVGYQIIGPEKSALFIPDIDKWERWDQSILELIQQVDYAFLDATFFDGKELDNRDMSLVPHPFMVESLDLFDTLEISDRNKVYFIHFNHTNPVLDADSEAANPVNLAGFNIAQQGQHFPL